MATRNTAQQGMDLLAAELRSRGFPSEQVEGSRRNELLVRRSRHGVVRVRVKTRTSGTWQGTTNDADATSEPNEDRFVVFVDLANGAPGFYVVPEWWHQQDVHRELVEYLARHPGPRSSTHHAIPVTRIEQWHERWDLLS